MNKKKEKIRFVYEEIREDEREPTKFIGYEDDGGKLVDENKPTFGVMIY